MTKKIYEKYGISTSKHDKLPPNRIDKLFITVTEHGEPQHGWKVQQPKKTYQFDGNSKHKDFELIRKILLDWNSESKPFSLTRGAEFFVFLGELLKIEPDSARTHFKRIFKLVESTNLTQLPSERQTSTPPLSDEDLLEIKEQIRNLFN